MQNYIDIYWTYSTLILVEGECEMAAKASVDMATVEGQVESRQRSTTFTSTVAPPLQGLLRPLRHLSLYRLPHAAPLSHNPSLTATNRFPGGNWSCLLPKHFVAAQQLQWH